MRQIPKLFLLTILIAVYAVPVAAQAAITAQSDQASLSFPDTITFSANFTSSVDINSIVLEYGVEQQTCGTVVAKAIPQFTPSNKTNVTWTWEMRQSGSLPPGARVWWRWQVGDSAGNHLTTETQTVTWLDNRHKWQTVSGGDTNLHWYNSDQAFGDDLHAAAVDALVRLGNETGLKAAQPVDLYIYANYTDMRDAILYEPGWTGGMAFPEYSIVIIGISPDNIDWGKTTEAHELTHVLVGNLTFSCLGDVPTWLSEGLAVWGEGGLDPSSQDRLDTAISENTLFPLRSLSGGFSEIADKADLSYSQSYSVVKFLIDTYGKDKTTEMLIALRDGSTTDAALQSIYGFNIEGLEDAWRAGIGAQARQAAPNPTPTAQPTPVPTIRPVSGAPLAVSPTPMSPSIATPTSAQPGSMDTGEAGSAQPNWLMLALSCLCCLVILAIMVALVFIFIRKAQNKDAQL